MGFIADLLGASNKYHINEGTQGVANFQNYANAITNMIGGTGEDPLAAQQQDYISMLQQQMGGGGPSVAQNQLAQASDMAQQQAAGQVANIRGLNPATAARLALQNQASQAQQAAGQAATMRAQEMMANQGQLGQALAQGRDANTSRLSTLGQLQGQQNAQSIQKQLGAAQINSGVAAQNAQTNQGIGGGLIGGIASALFAKGGKVPPVQYMDDGGVVLPANLANAAAQYAGDTSFARALMGAGNQINAKRVARNNAENDAMMAAASMGEAPQVVPALNMGGMLNGVVQRPVPNVQPWQPVQRPGLNPNAGLVQRPTVAGPSRTAMGGMGGAPQNPNARVPVFARAEGGKVPGKAEVPGDSYQNDKVPAMLSPGEVVVPRTVVNNPDPDAAKEFVQAVKKQGAKGAKKEMSYGEVLKAHQALQDRVAQLEAFACGGRVGYADGGAVKSPVSKESADKFNEGLQNAFGYGSYLNNKKKKA